VPFAVRLNQRSDFARKGIMTLRKQRVNIQPNC